jgi:hypothetical protein
VVNGWARGGDPSNQPTVQAKPTNTLFTDATYKAMAQTATAYAQTPTATTGLNTPTPTPRPPLPTRTPTPRPTRTPYPPTVTVGPNTPTPTPYPPTETPTPIPPTPTNTPVPPTLSVTVTGGSTTYGCGGNVNATLTVKNVGTGSFNWSATSDDSTQTVILTPISGNVSPGPGTDMAVGGSSIPDPYFHVTVTNTDNIAQQVIVTFTCF